MLLLKEYLEYTERTVIFLQGQMLMWSQTLHFKIIPIYDTLGNSTYRPIRDGYEFKGWFTSEGVKATPDLIITEDITFYPRWEEIVIIPVDGEQVNCSAVIMGKELIVTANKGCRLTNTIVIYSVDPWEGFPYTPISIL